MQREFYRINRDILNSGGYIMNYFNECIKDLDAEEMPVEVYNNIVSAVKNYEEYNLKRYMDKRKSCRPICVKRIFRSV